jgi:hypothetical protein
VQKAGDLNVAATKPVIALYREVNSMTPTMQAAPPVESAPLSDEAILGIEPESAFSASGSDSQLSADAIDADFASRDTAPGAENRGREENTRNDGREEQRAEDSRNDDQRDAENATNQESKPQSDKNTERTPPLTSLAEFDAGFYSGDAASRTALAQSLFSSDPAAFRAMFDEAARLLGVTASPREGKNSDARESASREPTPALVDNSAATNAAAQNNSANAPGTDAPAAFPAESYRAFEASTNEAVASDVRSAITRTLGQVLPEGVAEGAAKRIGDDIFGEVGKLLAADAQLSSQVGEALRGWRFGQTEQQQVASLLSGRARQILPSVARRVIGEWTNSVLSTARTRATRSDAAARRVDVGGAASGEAAARGAARTLRPREIDYARTSDDDIFAM